MNEKSSQNNNIIINKIHNLSMFAKKKTLNNPYFPYYIIGIE